MKAKALEILIVVLLALALTVGCKDEAEGIEFVNCTFQENEPNEPESVIDISTEGIRFVPFDIHKIIPTWPDYIELDRTLVLRYDYPEPNSSPYEISILPRSVMWTFGKGTKIYFKEEPEPNEPEEDIRICPEPYKHYCFKEEE